MGNRAVITNYEKNIVGENKYSPSNIGVYLHWNGGRESVEAFLTYCQLKGYRTPSSDNYGWARFCQVVGNFFGGTNSIGIDTCNNLDCDNYDNGVYLIEGWKVVGRAYTSDDDEPINDDDLLRFLICIDEKQPKDEQLGVDFIEENYKL